MKKILISGLALVAFAATTHAQDMMGKLKSEATKQVSAAAANPSAIVGSKGPEIRDAIMSKLGPALKLTEPQKAKVSSAIDGYLNKKASLAPTAATDKASYTKQSAAAQSGLMSQIKGAISKGQYAQFLKMKPKAGDTSNPLSAIFNK